MFITATSSLQHISFTIITLITLFSPGFLPVSVQSTVNWPQVELSPPISGFTNPVHVTHAGDGSGRLFVSEEKGRVIIIKNGQVLTTPFLDLSSKVSTREGALVGLAFPPGYASKN